MSESETQASQAQLLVKALDKREHLWESLKVLEQMPEFKELILMGYLGNLPHLKDQLLRDIGRDEENKDVKKEYQEKARFHEYLEGVRKGKDAWYWKELHRKAEAGEYTDDELAAIVIKGDKQ